VAANKESPGEPRPNIIFVLPSVLQNGEGRIPFKGMFVVGVDAGLVMIGERKQSIFVLVNVG
jgi:hypothetical protein